MNKNKLYSAFLFLWSPLSVFLNFCLSSKIPFSERNLRFVGSLFFIYFGLNYSVPEYSNGDEVRFEEIFYQVKDNIHDINSLVYYVLEGKSPTEFFVPTCAFVGSFFNINLYFALLSITYGYVFIECLVIIKRVQVPSETKKYMFFLMLFFSLIYPFWNCINGVRFGTVTMIFFVAITRMVESQRFFAPIFLAPLIHIGSLIFVIIYVLVFYFNFFGKFNLNLFYIVYYLSFLLNLFATDFLTSAFGGLGEGFLESESNSLQGFAGYNNQEYLIELRSEQNNLNWNMKLEANLSYFLPFIIASYNGARVYFNNKMNNLKNELSDIHKIALFFLIIVNFLSPAVGSVERYTNISLFLFFYIIFNDDEILYFGVLFLLRFIIIIILLILIILKIRGGFDLVDVNLMQPVFFEWINDVNIRIGEIWEATGGFNR